MKNGRVWRKVLALHFEKKAAAEIMEQTRQNYMQLRESMENDLDPILKKHLCTGLFPQIALYKTLKQKGKNRKQAYALTQQAHFESLKGMKRKYKWIGSLPFSFIYVRIVLPYVLRKNHPCTGWDIEWRENSKTCVSFFVHRCFYLDVLNKYDEGELIRIYCEGDDFLFQGTSPYIIWGRQCTIPKGDRYCDTTFYKNNSKKMDNR